MPVVFEPVIFISKLLKKSGYEGFDKQQPRVITDNSIVGWEMVKMILAGFSGGIGGGVPSRFTACLLLTTTALLAEMAGAGESVSDDDIALSLANMLRAGRTVIAANQTLINDPDRIAKGLTGEVVLEEVLRIYQERTSKDPAALDRRSRPSRLLRAQMIAIREVLDEHQSTINKPGVGFKGFVPAVFARLVNEKFNSQVGGEAEVKVTAPAGLVRNRKARPDEWEQNVINTMFSSGDWPINKVFTETTTKDERSAYRVLVPEYYSQNCLSCHGEPKGEIDVTGYPKEGGQLGQLGGVISITLYK